MESTPGSRLRRLRELLGFPGQQKEFAERIGLTQQSVSNMERDKTEPAAKSLNKIYDAFPQVSISWLVTGVGEPLDTMRDGRELTPIIGAAPSIETKNPGEPAGLPYGDAVELAIANARIADRDEIIRRKDARITELLLELGKSNDSPGAAGPLPTTPRKPVDGFLTSTQRAALAAAFNEFVEAELSEGNLVPAGR